MLTYGECDLHPQEHPIVDKLLHLDDVQSLEYGILDLVGIGHEFLGTVSFCIFCLPEIFFVSWCFPTSVSMSSSFLDDTLRD